MTKATYFAAAFSDTTRIPGQDGPRRRTIDAACDDVNRLPRAWSYQVKATSPETGERDLTADEWASLEWAETDAEALAGLGSVETLSWDSDLGAAHFSP